MFTLYTICLVYNTVDKTVLFCGFTADPHSFVHDPSKEWKIESVQTGNDEGLNVKYGIMNKFGDKAEVHFKTVDSQRWERSDEIKNLTMFSLDPKLARTQLMLV